MAAAGAGTAASPRAARQVHVGRSDGRVYTTQEITSKRKTAANQIGEPIPEDWSQIADAESRGKMIQWKVVIGTGLSEELAWPKGELAWQASRYARVDEPTTNTDCQTLNISCYSRKVTA